LLAELLLQRTRAESVVPVYKEIVDKYPEPEDMVNAKRDVLKDILFTLGLPERVDRIIELASELADKGEVPGDYAGLVDLPGVGDYIASAWLSFSGTARSVIVDSNVARWLSRMTGRKYNGETRRKKWVRELADRITPARVHRRYNYAMLDFTREICKPISPLCDECTFAKDLCSYGSGDWS
jgi:A/G-specific adenine glycosylase